MNAVDELNALLGIGPPKVKLPLTLERSGYQAVRPIGKGGFGQAHLVFHKSSQKYFVVKHVNMASMSSKQRKEAHNEITTLQQLDHPNIVRYVEYVEEHPHLYIVMEYADGGDLFGHLKKVATTGKQLGEPQVMALFTQTVLAVKHMHDRRMLHRDIKSQNVFLTKSHVVKLGDFGISTVLNSTMAMAQTMCGTPCYFSPELCAGKPYNNKSDIWALGVLLYELCTAGELPFEGANVKALMDAIVRTPARRIPAQYSDCVATLVQAMMHKDPKQRPDINGVLQSPAVQNACPALVAQLSTLAPPPPPPPRLHSAKQVPLPASLPPRPAPSAAASAPPAVLPPTAHIDDHREVMLAEAPPPLKEAAVAPHQHFNDTNAGTAYVPALLQQAARAAAAADDDQPGKISLDMPGRDEAGPAASSLALSEPAAAVAAPELSRVIEELQSTIRRPSPGTATVDEATSTATGDASSPSPGTPAAVSTLAATDGAPPHQEGDFDDLLGTTVDRAAIGTGIPQQQAASVQPVRSELSPVRRTALAKTATGARDSGLRLSSRQRNLLRSFAAGSSPSAIALCSTLEDPSQAGGPTGASAASVLDRQTTGTTSATSVTEDTTTSALSDEGEDDDTCIGGHCLCGATVYAGWLSMAVGTFTCNCMACRRFSGNATVEWIHFPDVTFPELLQQSPAARSFVVAKDAIELYFCGECGSSLAMLHENIDGCIVARATLSDASAQVFDEATRAAASSDNVVA